MARTTIIVELSDTAHEQLKRRAEAMGSSPEALSREILERELDTCVAEPKSPREILAAAGQVRPIGANLRSTIKRDVSLAKVRAAFAAAGGPTLSDLILEQRGPRV